MRDRQPHHYRAAGIWASDILGYLFGVDSGSPTALGFAHQASADTFSETRRPDGAVGFLCGAGGSRSDRDGGERQAQEHCGLDVAVFVLDDLNIITWLYAITFVALQGFRLSA